MSESAKPKRSWFRFHLWTLILMTIFAGSLLGTNIYEQKIDGGSGSGYEFIRRGWPLVYSEASHFYYPSDIAEKWQTWEADDLPKDAKTISSVNLTIDVTFGCVLLSVLTFVSEWLIRRREGRTS